MGNHDVKFGVQYLEFAYDAGGNSRSVVRGGYGLFYDKTHFELITAIITGGVFSDSFLVDVPANAADPGPSLGQIPSNPLLSGGPTVNRALLNQLYPPGSRVRNTGTVFLDSPDAAFPTRSRRRSATSVSSARWRRRASTTCTRGRATCSCPTS